MLGGAAQTLNRARVEPRWSKTRDGQRARAGQRAAGQAQCQTARGATALVRLPVGRARLPAELRGGRRSPVGRAARGAPILLLGRAARGGRSSRWAGLREGRRCGCWSRCARALMRLLAGLREGRRCGCWSVRTGTDAAAGRAARGRRCGCWSRCAGASIRLLVRLCAGADPAAGRVARGRRSSRRSIRLLAASRTSGGAACWANSHAGVDRFRAGPGAGRPR
jgi:hypothetical protein